ncbi:quinoprotein relay system zinc metallohydrolase 2 [Methyloversatilis thermotolerans]|uniref:quinoprotein relay system zinc metallohydrolase 2 n=1 Tax=Methyloversatilis thermotolerans TaxID=1346290 RepID=UPI001E441EB6|nr:quinoprotein relay system zinc metallohydrolase 2 [Methyloversatilis thermotolerans]
MLAMPFIKRNSGARTASFAARLLIVLLSIGAAHAVEPLPVDEIAPGVFVFHGVTAEQDAHNRGAISNAGFVVGSRCVAVIDTGGSPSVGAALRAAIRTRTALPVCYVINTHVHPDHILGNQAFIPDKPEFIGHARLPAALAARARSYIQSAERQMGEFGRGLELIPPTRTVADREELDLGGRTLRLRAWPTAHTDNDLTVLDEATGTLFAGDLLFVEHMPVIDGKLKGWIAVTAALAGGDYTRVVAGHGEPGSGWRDALERQRRYLQKVADETRAAIKGGRSLSQAVTEVALDEARRWALADLFHRRNVTTAYAELEWED